MSSTPKRPSMEDTKRGLNLDFSKARGKVGIFDQQVSLQTPILDLSTPDFQKLLCTEELTLLTPNGISSVLMQESILQSPVAPLIPITVDNSTSMMPTMSAPIPGPMNEAPVSRPMIAPIPGPMFAPMPGPMDATTQASSYSNLPQPMSTDIQPATIPVQNTDFITTDYVVIKEEPNKEQQMVEMDKVERKRERNRLAAKKCRQRKLETIEELKKTVAEWERKYAILYNEYERLKSLRLQEAASHCSN